MKIVQIEPPSFGGEGDHIYRTVQPCRALGALPGVLVVSGTALSGRLQGLMEECDVLILCDAADLEYLSLVERRRRRGKITVYEINDNFLDVPPWNLTASFSRDPAHWSLMLQLGRECDGLQFSMPQLKTTFEFLNPNVAVFPNHLWEVPGRREKRGGDVVVGWGGSEGHLDDIKWLMPVLEWLLHRHPEVRLAVMAPSGMRDLFGWAPPERCSFREAGSLEAYYSFLGELDVGIAPLLPTEFNRCRSDVKFLEYASRGVVALCSDWWPYRYSVRSSENGLLFNGLEELKTHLSELVRSPNLRERIAGAAFDYVATERVEGPRAADRREFYGRLLEQAEGGGGADLAPGWFDKMVGKGPSRCFPGTAYREVVFGRGEKHLYNALLAQEDSSMALVDLEKAAQCLEGSHWPHLIAGSLHGDWEDAVLSLQKALLLTPGSGSAAFLLGTRYLEGGEVERARVCYEEFLKSNPLYAPGYERLGRVWEEKGEHERALVAYEAALERNPFYSIARYRLVEMRLEAGEVPLAEALLEARPLVLSSDWMGWYWEGRVAFALTRLNRASEAFERAWSLVEKDFYQDVLGEEVPGLAVLAYWAKVELERGEVELAGELLSRYRLKSA